MQHSLAENFFRHEYGKVVAVLCSHLGLENIDRIEDSVQTALLQAVESWPVNDVPENPSGWIFRVAKNKVLEDIRRVSRREKLLKKVLPNDIHTTNCESEIRFSLDIADDLLRMLFACCDESNTVNGQLVLALKLLCGFSVKEISLRLFLKEDTVYKRLLRAKSNLSQQTLPFDTASSSEIPARLPVVLRVLYLMFTEGYLSFSDKFSIRAELCDEAIRLCTLLANHPYGDSPQTSAMLALFHLQRARMSSRQDGSGGLLLLEEQDRALWSLDEIQTGLEWLARSSSGNLFSRYHAEAAVAAEHCIALSFAQTRWDNVVENYFLLEQIVDSPIHTLNRAIAMAECQDAAAGLNVLNSCQAPTWLSESFVWNAVHAALYLRSSNSNAAAPYKKRAFELAPTNAIKELLARRLRSYDLS